MSYILEALKKSQSDRELGQVPRVQGFGIDVPMEPPRRRPWAYLALLLALLALGAAGFLMLRGLGLVPTERAQRSAAVALPAPTPQSPHGEQPIAAGPSVDVASARPAPSRSMQPPPEPSTPVVAAPATALDLPPPETATPAAGPPVAAAPLSGANTAPPPLGAGAEPPRTAAAPTGPLSLTDPDSLSVEPEVLVVPAPPKHGQPLPRGADELRRAVLGDGARTSASVADSRALPTPPPPGQPLPSGPAPVEHAPVPQDLLAEIDAFKKLVRKQDPSATKRAARAPPPLPTPPALKLRPPKDEVPLPQAPSLDLRNRLPPFSMTVHVYNADPRRRFIYINGRKLTEHEESREGLRLERVVADGAVLSYQGESFFQRR